jgi:hypothetical protein
MNIKNTCAGRPRRLMFYLLRPRVDPAAAVPVERLGHVCFGSVDGRDTLALKQFMAGQKPSAYGPPLERPDHDRSDRLG